MKKVEFGFANDLEPNGSWEGLGIKDGLLLIEADYFGVVKLENNSYLVAKVLKDQYNRFPELLGKFIVRDALADMYKDGSGIIYLNQEQSIDAKLLEEHLNNPIIYEHINNLEDILLYSDGLEKGDKIFEYLTMDDNVLTTSITSDAFERKNAAFKVSHESLSELTESNRSR